MNKPSILYLGPRGLSGDLTGTAWNLRKLTLTTLFKSINANTKYLTFDRPTPSKVHSVYLLSYFLLTNILQGRVLPLQEILILVKYCFSDVHCQITLLQKQEYKPSLIFLESTRTAFLIPFLKSLRTFSDIPITMDMDDVLSLRYSHWSKQSDELSIGFLSSNAPLRFLLRLCNWLRLKRLFLLYEAWLLEWTEMFILNQVDSVALISPTEADYMKTKYPLNSAKVFSTSLYDPDCPNPSSDPQISDQRYSRFVFVGSDRQPQNRTAIKNIIDTWTASSIQLPVYIYGKMEKSYPPTPGVIFQGYADSISSVFSNGSILLNPTTTPGGIKVKSIQAIVRHVPILGLVNAFDGLPASSNTLNCHNLKHLSEILASTNVHELAYKQLAAQTKHALPLLTQSYFENCWFKSFA